MNEADLKKIYIVEQLNYEKKLIMEMFEEEEIDYIFLKGATVRNFYPEPWMRTSADVDVLVREKDYGKAEKVLKQNGHIFSRRDEHSTSFYSEIKTQLDLHRYAIPPGGKGYEIALKVWDDAEKVSPRGHEYKMTPDMLYFIHIAHTAKHFVMGGGNEYSIKDVIYIEKEYGKGLARDYLEEAGLLDFAEVIEEISSHDIYDDSISDDAKTVRRILLDGSILGSPRNSEIGWNIITGGGMNYYVKRLFPPIWNMKFFYPVLKSMGGTGIVLLPACYIHRITKAFTSGVWKDKAREVKQKSNISAEQIEERKSFLEKYNLI